MRDPIKPVVKAQQSNALVYDQGITYNEAGLTYNELGVAYGGLYGQDVVPTVSLSKETVPTSLTIHAPIIKLSVQKTNALVYDPGITYNESGLSYNEVGYAYGGLYEHDITSIVPTIQVKRVQRVLFTDFGTGQRGILLEDGYFLLLEDGATILLEDQ